ncbi:MAG: hypothetical protein WC511_05655 [Candidatus Pacearchaeota archaeon]
MKNSTILIVAGIIIMIIGGIVFMSNEPAKSSILHKKEGAKYALNAIGFYDSPSDSQRHLLSISVLMFIFGAATLIEGTIRHQPKKKNSRDLKNNPGFYLSV